MLIHKTKILSHPYSHAIDLQNENKVSCESINENIQIVREHGNEPEYILLTYPQYNELNRELQSQQRFVSITRVTDSYVSTYRGIIVIPYEPKCPLCSKEIWHKDGYVFSCDKHYKQILAMNKLAG